MIGVRCSRRPEEPGLDECDRVGDASGGEYEMLVTLDGGVACRLLISAAPN